ncbi:uncharacterized protein TRIADDRAFT_58070 [Trichoplax adhaerens]|uniref:Uncharacterized protein n=1 Tax=Trichoplax adhaerens TaxID=10228 RepID=B3S2L7_TRIAD|nr:predicted protein [Trichoplax adhaerens]EDV23441.1 predicted protein [Trichoplax adhaerens]|eukprot:XP_002114351.1 predicted protein [Trichoplax adhaerens]
MEDAGSDTSEDEEARFSREMDFKRRVLEKLYPNLFESNISSSDAQDMTDVTDPNKVNSEGAESLPPIMDNNWAKDDDDHDLSNTDDIALPRKTKIQKHVGEISNKIHLAELPGKKEITLNDQGNDVHDQVSEQNILTKNQKRKLKKKRRRDRLKEESKASFIRSCLRSAVRKDGVLK